LGHKALHQLLEDGSIGKEFFVATVMNFHRHAKEYTASGCGQQPLRLKELCSIVLLLLPAG